jgi:hypothetical protein
VSVRTSALEGSIALLCCLLPACSNGTVDQAIGTAQENQQIVISTSASSITIENQVGRPLLDVRVTVPANRAEGPFFALVPTVDAGERREIPLGQFRTEDGTLLGGGSSGPADVRVTARDTLGNSYDVTRP